MIELVSSLSPAVCQKFAIYCDSCVQSRAHSVARISPGLNPSDAARLFRVLYPSEGCAPMRDHFLVCYREEIELEFALVTVNQEPQFVA